jgi:hypothetical protein
VLAVKTPGHCREILDRKDRPTPNPSGCEMPQVRITKRRRTADTAWRRRQEPLLPLDPRDPEITRAKQLQRRRG